MPVPCLSRPVPFPPRIPVCYPSHAAPRPVPSFALLPHPHPCLPPPRSSCVSTVRKKKEADALEEARKEEEKRLAAADHAKAEAATKAALGDRSAAEEEPTESFAEIMARRELEVARAVREEERRQTRVLEIKAKQDLEANRKKCATCAHRRLTTFRLSPFACPPPKPLWPSCPTMATPLPPTAPRSLPPQPLSPCPPAPRSTAPLSLPHSGHTPLSLPPHTRPSRCSRAHAI